MNINYHFVEEKEVFSPALIYYRDMIQKNHLNPVNPHTEGVSTAVP